MAGKSSKDDCYNLDCCSSRTYQELIGNENSLFKILQKKLSVKNSFFLLDTVEF